jgi:hypothetical protein
MAGGSGGPAEEELWSRAGQRGVAAVHWPPGREDGGLAGGGYGGD